MRDTLGVSVVEEEINCSIIVRTEQVHSFKCNIADMIFEYLASCICKLNDSSHFAGSVVVVY